MKKFRNAFLAFFFCAAAANADIYQNGIGNYHGARDTYIDPYSPSANYASSTIIRATNAFKALLRFDISAIPANATVNSATLGVFILENYNNGGGNRIFLHRVLNKSWIDVESTWNFFSTGNAWSAAGMGAGVDYASAADAISTVGYLPSNTWANFDVTGLVREWVNQGLANNGIVILSGNGPRVGLASSEYTADPALRPKLSVDYTIPADTTPPTVTITAPTAAASVVGSIVIAANANDNVDVAGVRFQIDQVDIGAEDTSLPYQAAWNSATVANGSHTLTAIARDSSGNVSSNSIAIRVDNGAVTFQRGRNNYAGTIDTYIDSPNPSANYGSAASIRAGETFKTLLRFELNSVPANATVRSATLSVYVGSNSGNSGGNTVYLHRLLDRNWLEYQANWTHYRSDSIWSAAGMRAGSDYSTSADSSAVVGYLPANIWANFNVTGLVQNWINGTYPNNGVVIRSGNGPRLGILSSEHQPDIMLRPKLVVEYIVPVSDTSPPNVSIYAPANTSTVNGTIAISAQATDNVGVAGVQFRVGQTTLGAEDTTAPYGISWNTSAVADGTHTLTATARDAAGNQSSHSISVTVNNAPPTDTTPPSVSFIAPASGATVAGTVNASVAASDNVAVAGVQFKVDGANYGSERTSPPYAVSWNTADLPNGNHTLSAIARDTAGLATTADITVTVQNGAKSYVITWNAVNDTRVVGYRVYRGTSEPLTRENAIGFQDVGNATSVLFSAADWGLAPGTKLFAGVAALAGDGTESALSNIDSIVIE